MSKKFNFLAALWGKMESEKRRKEAAKRHYERKKEYDAKCQREKENRDTNTGNVDDSALQL